MLIFLRLRVAGFLISAHDIYNTVFNLFHGEEGTCNQFECFAGILCHIPIYPTILTKTTKVAG